MGFYLNSRDLTSKTSLKNEVLHFLLYPALHRNLECSSPLPLSSDYSPHVVTGAPIATVDSETALRVEASYGKAPR